MDLIHQYPNKDFVLDLPKGKALDWKKIKICADGLNPENNLFIKLYDLTPYLELSFCKNYNIKYFYAYPAKNFFELNNLKKLGVSYVYIDAPLFFQMPTVKKIGVPIRLIPNIAYYPSDNIYYENGLHGIWVRPEVLDIYEPYVSIVEFFYENIKEEKAYFKIYMQDKEWNNDINSIIYGINMHFNNHLVFEELDEIRLKCKQECELPKKYCHLCDSVVRFETVGREWALKEIERRKK